MNEQPSQVSRWPVVRGLLLSLAVFCGLTVLVAVLVTVPGGLGPVRADPIPPPEGYPKLTLSLKVVSPTLVSPGGATLAYEIEIRNTGAYTAAGVTLIDEMPAGTTYNNDVQAATGTVITTGTTLTWTGDVGFDETVLVGFSVDVDPAFTGTLRNTAVISQALIAEPITVTAETVVAERPVLAIAKTSVPPKPGANKPLTYTLVITNLGQPATGMQLSVTDTVPADTSFRWADPDGAESGGVVEWTRDVTLGFGESTTFAYSVDVGDVPSGTVIVNEDYQASSAEAGLAVGQPYTVTVVDPVFRLSKYVWPDPPGANREMTYTLKVLNLGSLATNVVVSDRVPSLVEYRRGGTYAGGVVSWALPRLDTGESANVTYTVYVGDLLDVAVINDDYWVCSAEDVCQPGTVLTTVVRGPTFEAEVTLDPIAKKPGGGGGPVTPTLVVRNLGPGNALGATALLEFRRISVSGNDLYAIPATGTPPPFPEINCGDKCVYFVWSGDLAYGDAITFTTVGQSTKGGEEGEVYTATVIVTDTLGGKVTDPVEESGTGKVTHLANLIPMKQAVPVIARGELLTYTIQVWNSGLTVDGTPAPVLTDVVPMSTTLVAVSDGGTSETVSDTTVISWVLPALSTGDRTWRWFSVRVNDDLVSGTQILNSDYYATWNEAEDSTPHHNAGQPVTTTVVEAGLVDSFKTVEPMTVLPGPGNVLTFCLHIVNSSAVDLSGVTVEDLLPWQDATYQRDAVAGAGTVYSDIVSVHWQGDVAAFSTELLTLTVEVDPEFAGPITNTAVISHPDLLAAVETSAVAYITDKPVLQITKSASPDPVRRGKVLAYEIQVVNLGQQATDLVVTDTVPGNTEFVPHSASAGLLQGRELSWRIPVLETGESHISGFWTTVRSGDQVVNDKYGVRCAEGVVAIGEPVVTEVRAGPGTLYLPLVVRN